MSTVEVREDNGLSLAPARELLLVCNNDIVSRSPLRTVRCATSFLTSPASVYHLPPQSFLLPPQGLSRKAFVAYISVEMRTPKKSRSDVFQDRFVYEAECPPSSEYVMALSTLDVS